MIGIMLDASRQRTLRAVLAWMATDAELKSAKNQFAVVELGKTEATREQWSTVALAADIWGTTQAHPFDAIALAGMIERRLREVPVVPNPIAEPKRKTQACLFGGE